MQLSEVYEYKSLLIKNIHSNNAQEEADQVVFALDILFELEPDESKIISKLKISLLAIEEINLKYKAIIALLLNDYINNSEVKDRLQKSINPQIFSIIDGLNKVLSIISVKVGIYSENYLKLLLTQADDVRVILILLVLKLHDVRNIKSFEEQNRIELCRQLSSLYAPLAHRLGLYKIKTEMEEQSMKYLHNDVYKSIAEKLSEKKGERDIYIENFIKPIKKGLDEKGLKYTIKGRPKSIHSIWNKLKKNNFRFESIYDLFAIRIILDSKPENEKADCWNVYSVVSDIYRPNPNRLRDWISSPKISGYESLHTTVVGPDGKWVEIQIRTERMDEIAEKGHAAHWKYKEGVGNGGGSESWLSKIRKALENPDESDIEESSSRIELYSEEIFYFYPSRRFKKTIERCNNTRFCLRSTY
ncbi:MAG: bifunctional (p)ppGpp synthetase/guanosine-3',5'-bis(diphosphate) 3'-pyrophosphohydrolase [Bacteroidales bacterium]|nr:bifunctional (p)ppGpp synthetase/guanosine-3',5'-bis(diphosphate) 3'-pyrophosphohydrolase [Bacteroidales bacterium]